MLLFCLFEVVSLVETGDEGNNEIHLLSEIWGRTTGTPHPVEGSRESWAGLGAPLVGLAGGYERPHALYPPARALAPSLSRFHLTRSAQPPPSAPHPPCVHVPRGKR